MQLDPEYKENLFLTVDVWHETTEKRTALKKKLDAVSLRSDSKIICFEEDEVYLPKGFNCTIQLQILDFCWYKELPQPTADKFVASSGELLLTRVSFEVTTGAVDEIPKFCPISRIFLRPVTEDCIVLHDWYLATHPLLKICIFYSKLLYLWNSCSEKLLRFMNKQRTIDCAKNIYFVATLCYHN